MISCLDKDVSMLLYFERSRKRLLALPQNILGARAKTRSSWLCTPVVRTGLGGCGPRRWNGNEWTNEVSA